MAFLSDGKRYGNTLGETAHLEERQIHTPDKRRVTKPLDVHQIIHNFVRPH